MGCPTGVVRGNRHREDLFVHDYCHKLNDGFPPVNSNSVKKKKKKRFTDTLHNITRIYLCKKKLKKPRGAIYNVVCFFFLSHSLSQRRHHHLATYVSYCHHSHFFLSLYMVVHSLRRLLLRTFEGTVHMTISSSYVTLRFICCVPCFAGLALSSPRQRPKTC